MGYIPELDPLRDAGPIEVDGAIDADEIVEGDLIFTSRPGLLQDLCDRAGEPWRHVGLATVHDGVPSITEVSRHRFDIRPLTKVVASNQEVAVGRIDPDERHLAAKAAQWCLSHGREEQLYAWHDVMLAGMIAIARHYSRPAEREALHRAIEAAADVVGSRRPRIGTLSYTCAAFVAEGFDMAGCGLELDVRVPRAVAGRPPMAELIRGRRRPQLRSRARPSTQEYGIVLYALLAGMVAASLDAELGSIELDQFRWAMPGDLWRSPTVSERYIVLPASEPTAGGDER
ncbi:MAG: hypothetical protein OEV40_06655 [Acidimicrobiia bacterium]|nr:hypothetical protein [Acidimicrobiia bacterium]